MSRPLTLEKPKALLKTRFVEFKIQQGGFFYFLLLLTLATTVFLSGCASVPVKPKPSAGQVIGAGIDQAISFTSKGIQAIINRGKNS